MDIIHIPVYALLPHLLPSEASKTRLSTMPAFVQFPDVQPVEGHVSPSKNLAAVPHHKEDARSGHLRHTAIHHPTNICAPALSLTLLRIPCTSRGCFAY